MNGANLAIQAALAVLAMVTLIFVVGAFLGLREARNIRDVRDELRQATDETRALKASLEAEIADLNTDFEQLVQVAHLFQEGQNAYTQGDYDRAVLFYEDALELQPENVRILSRLGRCYTNKGRTSRAEHYFRQALRADETNVEALRGLAASRRYQNLDEAIDYAERAANLDPADAESWNYLGLLQRDADLIEDAIASHREALSIVPTDSITEFYLASLLFRQGSSEASRYITDAKNHLDRLESLKRIKPIWAEVVRWAYSYITDPSGQGAITSAEQLAVLAKEERNRRAVLSHMIFILGEAHEDANGLHPCLLSFPPGDVAMVRTSVS